MIAAGIEIEGRAIYDLQPRQVACLQKTPLARDPWQEGPTRIGYGGAAGGGKSYLARAVAAIAALKWPGSTGIIFRRTYPEVRDNHIVKLRAEVPEVLDGRRLYTYSAQDKAVQWANGSRTLFGFLERDEHVYRYQGSEYDLMVFEEATHYSWFQVSWLTGNRLRSSVAGTMPFALYPSNPGNRGHAWYKRIFLDRDYREDLNEDPDDFAFVPAKVEDNYALLDIDPAYLKRLNSLPEPLRSQLKDGDWNAGTVTALGEMRRDVHLIEPFDVPEHWTRFNAFDWGFNHPFSFGHFATDTDGVVYLLDTVRGRHLKDHEIIERIHVADGVDVRGSKYTVAGWDCWHEHRAYSQKDTQETTAERFSKAEIPLKRANISRVAGLKNMRHYVDTSRTGMPRFYVVDTPGNRHVFQTLEQMVTDPDNVEDVLKVDADDYGFGGDDDYDMVRYALASRPIVPNEPQDELPSQDYDPAYEAMIERYERSQGQSRGF